MTEPHHALTVDGEGEDSGGNEVHEIYVRLEAGAREQPPSPVRNKDGDVVGVEGWGGSDRPWLPNLTCSIKKPSFQRL